MTSLFTNHLRRMRIGKRITLMLAVNVLVAVLLLALAWLGMQRMQQQLAETERLRDQSMRLETISKKALRLMLLARQYMDQGGSRTVSQLAVYGTDLERFILQEARLDPSLVPHTEKLLTELQRFQAGFGELYTLQQNQSREYEHLLELSESIASFLAIVSANARGENAYDLLPELEKANRWLHQAIASVNRYYFAEEQYEEANNGLITLSIFLPAVADRAGNSLRTNYLNQAGELVEQYISGLEHLAQGKQRQQELAQSGLNQPQNEIQNTINDILSLNSRREQEGAQAMRRELEQMTLLGLSLVSGLLLLSGLLSWSIGRSITWPLGMLHKAVRDQAEGRAVSRLPEQGDDELAALSGAVRKVISLQAEKDALIAELEQARDETSQALDRIRTLLDNSGQGVLSFGADLLVEAEYSRECRTIFELDPDQDIAGTRAENLLCPHDPDEAASLAQNLERICLQQDPFRRELLVSLMPTELIVGRKHVEVAYRLLPAAETGSVARLMLLLTDVSRSRELQQAVEAESRRLSLVVAAVRNRDELLDVMDDFHSFLQDMQAPATEDDSMDTERVLRLLHTYKGLFGLMECIHLPHALHEAESRVATLHAGHDRGELAAAVDRSALERAAAEDLEIIRQALGDAFLESRGEVVLPAEKTARLLQLADVLAHHFGRQRSRDIEQGLELLRRLRHVDLRKLLERYPRMARQLAERQDKELEDFTVTGDEVLVDPDRLAPFLRSLVHVFRNAVDHGLESREEREAAGKNPAGKMRCHVHLPPDGGLDIEIADDGRGLDLERLRERALELGIDPSGDLAQLVFAQGLSTSSASSQEQGSQTDSPLSGRGVGLAAVRAEAERLGGTAAVHSEAGQGAQFVFHIPEAGAYGRTPA